MERRTWLGAIFLAGLPACGGLLGIGDPTVLEEGTGSTLPDRDGRDAGPTTAPTSADPPRDAGSSKATDADAAPAAKYVFVTTALWGGDLHGRDGADDLCNDEATRAGLPGVYQAWLSIGSASAYDRLAWKGAFQRPDHVIVVTDAIQLAQGKLAATITITAFAKLAVGDALTWTGTRADGSAAGDLGCLDWTTGAAIYGGMMGDNDQLDGRWTNNGGRPGLPPETWDCSQRGHLYCFEK